MASNDIRLAMAVGINKKFNTARFSADYLLKESGVTFLQGKEKDPALVRLILDGQLRMLIDEDVISDFKYNKKDDNYTIFYQKPDKKSRLKDISQGYPIAHQNQMNISSSMAEIDEPNEFESHRQTLRIPKFLLEKIDKKRKQTKFGKVSRNMCILQAIAFYVRDIK